MSNIKEIESEAFRKWFASQTTYGSLSAMERALNITKDYLHLIKKGSRRATNPELRRKLRESTGLESFNPVLTENNPPSSQLSEEAGPKPKTQESDISVKPLESGEPESEKGNKMKKQKDVVPLINEVRALREKVELIHAKLMEENICQEVAETSTDNAETKAKIIMRLLLSLSTELEFFKKCPESDRRKFKKIVPGQDVGYITSLLRALYDEDKFQRWLLFSSYTMKGTENSK